MNLSTPNCSSRARVAVLVQVYAQKHRPFPPSLFALALTVPHTHNCVHVVQLRYTTKMESKDLCICASSRREKATAHCIYRTVNYIQHVIYGVTTSVVTILLITYVYRSRNRVTIVAPFFLRYINVLNHYLTNRIRCTLHHVSGSTSNRFAALHATTVTHRAA